MFAKIIYTHKLHVNVKKKESHTKILEIIYIHQILNQNVHATTSIAFFDV